MQPSRIALLFLLLHIKLSAQEQQRDSVNINSDLNEVVVTGQFEPQSLKKSVQNVRVITRRDIDQLAANNLGDVLNQYVNITVRPSGTDGRSTVSMFGLDGLYFKILIDNVPIANEAGLGNNIDLSQINLNDVERIEIIEGSMGVTHGANAVSGILNIITKKSSKNKWEISATLQEETVGNEYATFDEGRHIQALQVSHTLTDNWFVSLNANRNDFQGYLGDRKGMDYAVNDDMRGYNWLPKEQLMTNALLSYRRNEFRFFYRFEMMDENIDYYNSEVETLFNAELGSYRASQDKRYFTDRFYHHLNATGKLFSGLAYNVSVSHQKQQRDVESFLYRVWQDQEVNNTTETDQSMEVLYSTGTLSNFFESETVKLQLGYELVNNNGFSVVQEADNVYVGIRERLENYDVFASSEVNVNRNFSLRPGFRYSFQSRFDNQYAASLGFRQLFKNDYQLRGAIGKSFRTPTFEELYTKMIFSGHYFTGNENLIPETSTSYEVSVKKNSYFDSGLMLSNNVIVSFMDIKDRISTAFTGYTPDNVPMYESINVSKYNMWNVSTTNQLQYNNLTFSLGTTLAGISQKLDNGDFQSDDKYLYTLNLNSSISYRVPKWKTTFSAYYKYNGKTQDYTASENEYVLTSVAATNWLDASIIKSFYNNRCDVTLGARNLLDITNVTRTGINQTGSHAASNNVMLAYGRSYYIKLMYNLNF
ncbi:outer membrane beta-barrel protein [Flavobacterium alkalisoli]|uniref:Outer membrane beta-barrel protein n=1 Tax=Flavobacterium alkalisoli TaxID=2602769 RepID=A0A5B9FPC2_9FLAO|nr:TonB-dependent receptor [Flavobacterium alkalisoli]QEE48820.1 outer membrane beta-barrel protein [Flavobacterium alkalisoli]